MLGLRTVRRCAVHQTTAVRAMGIMSSHQVAAPDRVATATGEQATFGAGCYWGTEKYFRKNFQQQFPGSIVEAQVGFMGPPNAKEDPTYREVCSGDTGHVEVVSLKYDPSKCKFEDLAKFFYSFHDPTTMNRQGNDSGEQYASAIFCHTPEQKAAAEKVTQELQGLLNAGKLVYKGRQFEGTKVTTAIIPATKFYPAHEDHQLYLDKNPGGYCNHSIRFLWSEQ